MQFTRDRSHVITMVTAKSHKLRQCLIPLGDMNLVAHWERGVIVKVLVVHVLGDRFANDKPRVGNIEGISAHQPVKG
jgi:hypothetical protein